MEDCTSSISFSFGEGTETVKGMYYNGIYVENIDYTYDSDTINIPVINILSDG